MAESPTLSSTTAPVDFTGVQPVKLENFAWLNPGWYQFIIRFPKYTPEQINSEGKEIHANISWVLMVEESLDPDFSEHVGKRIRDTFWYGTKNNFGIGRFMQAMEAIVGKRPAQKSSNLDLAPFEEKSVLARVDDNEWQGRTSTQIQEYANLSQKAQIQAEVDRARKLTPLGKKPDITEPDDLPLETPQSPFEG